MEKRHRSKPLKMAPYLISSPDIKNMVFMLLIRCYQVVSRCKSHQVPSIRIHFVHSQRPIQKYAVVTINFIHSLIMF